MDRRCLLISILGTSMCLSSVGAVARERRTIGFLSSSTTSLDSPLLGALREGLRERGYHEDQSLQIEYKFAHSAGELPRLAQELINKPVELILAAGSEAVVAARGATKKIPIVMTNSGDAVREGFAVSLARPGGNITGMTQISPELAGERLEILTEVFSDLREVGILWNPIHPNTPILFQETVAAAEKLGIRVHSFEVKSAEDIESKLSQAEIDNVWAFIVLRDPLIVRNRSLIVDGLHRRKFLAVFETPDFVSAGGLMSFGADLSQLFRESALYVDRILQGASPADLPIQQPRKFSLVINNRVATQRGIKLPSTLLVKADHLIE